VPQIIASEPDSADTPLQDSSDALFIAALQSGSEEAFNQLIAQFHQPVYSLIARSLHDPADAADITQEVFIKIYRGIRSFHGDSSLRTWIYRITLHEASNQRRWWSRHKRREVTLDANQNSLVPDQSSTHCLAETIADPRPTPFELVAQDQLRASVALALAQVPDVYRTVVVLREIEGCSYEEIATVLNINAGTVKSRLMRGRQALRNALAHQQHLAAKSTHIIADVSQPLSDLISHVEHALQISPNLQTSPEEAL